MNATDAAREQFLLMDAAGMSASRIAAAVGVSAKTITRWRRQAGRSRPYRPPLTPEVREQARALLDDGCCLAETARTVGVDPSTVSDWFPDVPRWTMQQRGEYSALLRRNRSILERKPA